MGESHEKCATTDKSQVMVCLPKQTLKKVNIESCFRNDFLFMALNVISQTLEIRKRKSLGTHGKLCSSLRSSQDFISRLHQVRVSQTLSTMPTLAVMKPIGGDGGQRLLLFQVHLIRVDNATIDHLVLVL